MPNVPYLALKRVSMINKNTQKNNLCVWEEGGTVDGGGEVTLERTTEADGAKFTAKKRRKIVKYKQKQG